MRYDYKGIQNLHDNTPLHKSKVMQQALFDSGFEQINHPAYSPNMTQCNYYLFRHLKSELRGQKFFNDDEIMEAIEDRFYSQSKGFYLQGIE